MAAASAPFVEKASAGVRDLWSALSTSEARYFDEERFSEAEIRKSLNDNLTDKKIEAMKRILAAVSAGRDASSLFPDVVKNVSFSSLELKKLIYIYLVQYAENNRELALLSINSFQKDLSDRSQLVRASALRALASIKVLEVIQLVMVAVRTCTNDSSSYVRKTAAQCMTKVYAVDPDQFAELRSLLLKLMSDHEVQVVGSAVMAFHHICNVQCPKTSAERSTDDDDDAASVRSQLAMLHPHYKRLCQDILLMDAWAQQSCIDVLLRYCRIFFASPERKPGSEGEAAEPPPAVSDDLLAFLRALKLLMCSNSQGVTLAAAVALCYLAPSSELGCVTLPVLRCLRQAPAESSQAFLVAVMPIIKGKPDLMRPSIREFFIQSTDFPGVKELKLKILQELVDETNVQMVLRELQAYVSWQSLPEFVPLAVQGISHVALKISSVADVCLRSLVKMLDSKCEALSCEAVIALRALLQRRDQSSDSGLGTVLPHLVHYLEDLAAPTARASVVWIIGQYQREVPRLAPDVVRKLVRTFASERQEVKRQILGLSLKVWSFHALNSRGEAPARKEPVDGKTGETGQKSVTPEESAQLLPRLEAMVDHISNLASFDTAWDVRDTARMLKRVKDAAKEGFNAGSQDGLSDLGLKYCRVCVSGKPAVDALEEENKENAVPGDNANGQFDCTWILGSLAQALDFPLETYRPLPNWAKESSSDELRKVKVEPTRDATAPKSISSSNIGNVQHIENRVQNPSNITNVPVASKLEDLDLFYTEEQAPRPVATKTMPTLAADAVQEPPATLESMRLGGPAPVVGTAVFGEDDESEEEAESEDDDDWKPPPPQPAVAPSAAAASVPTPTPSAAPPQAEAPVITPAPTVASALAPPAVLPAAPVSSSPLVEEASAPTQEATATTPSATTTAAPSPTPAPAEIPAAIPVATPSAVLPDLLGDMSDAAPTLPPAAAPAVPVSSPAATGQTDDLL